PPQTYHHSLHAALPILGQNPFDSAGQPQPHPHTAPGVAAVPPMIPEVSHDSGTGGGTRPESSAALAAETPVPARTMTISTDASRSEERRVGKECRSWWE